MKKIQIVFIVILIANTALPQGSVLSVKQQYEKQAEEYKTLYIIRNGEMEGTGYKQFFRNYQFILPRLDQDGSLNGYLHALELYEKQAGESDKSVMQMEEGNWTFLGPKGYPPTPDPAYSDASNGKGWVNCIWVDPMNHDRIYAGANRGGLWYTGDNGNNWKLLTGGYPNLIGIGDIIVYGDTIWVTCDMKDYFWGVARSQDGGISWEFLHSMYADGKPAYPSYNKNNRPMKLAIDPDNPNCLFLIAYNKIFRTLNAGNSWDLVHYEAGWSYWLDWNEGSGFWDIKVLDNLNGPNVVYAAGRKIIRSLDGGLSWEDETSDILASLGKNTVNDTIFRCDLSLDNFIYPGKIWFALLIHDSIGANAYVVKGIKALSVSPLYDDIPNSKNGLARQSMLNLEISRTNENCFYLGCMSIMKFNGLEYYCINCNSKDTYNSGNNNSRGCGPNSGPDHPNWIHVDIRGMKLLTENGQDVLFAANDGGVTRSLAAPDTGFWEWQKISDDGSCGLYVTEFYGIASSEKDPYHIAGGCQDVNCFVYDNDQWFHTGSYDGGKTLMDPENPSLVYFMRGAYLAAFLSRHVQNGVYFDKVISTGYYTVLEMGLEMDPNNSNTIYIGDTKLKKIINASGSTPSESEIPIPLDSVRVKEIIISKANSSIIHVFTDRTTGTYGPKIKCYYRLTGGGTSWEDLSSVCGLPFDSLFVSCGVANPLNANELWVGFGNVRLNNTRYIYHSTDGGNSFTPMNTTGYPQGIPMNDIEYDYITGKLYAATDVGLFFWDKYESSWIRYGGCLPYAHITDIELNYTARKMPAAVYGYGLWEASMHFCPPEDVVTLSGINTHGIFQEASESITSSQYLVNGNTKYIAPEVVLTNGFQISLGSLEIYNRESTCDAVCEPPCN